MQTERILITVRTYPTPSTSHRETVCVGGINDKLEWRRLYPVPLRYLDKDQQFKTWDVVQLGVKASRNDSRPESRRPHLPTLKITDHLKTWSARHDWVQPTVLPSMNAMIENRHSLRAVAVSEVMDLTVTDVSPDWDSKRLSKLETRTLFDEPLKLEKIPYEFRFVWRDQDGDEHTSLMISWEMAETWRKYRRRYDDPIREMSIKLLDDYFTLGRELAFFMGNHSRHRQVFMICGWFIPPASEVKGAQLFPSI